ncbi:MAG: DUF3108 domain-containing protein [Candidatus Tectomicrobia bacterium]|uniref:DUF3108 domain-containing protein n=1 Tax=Tectimicrobiota bacterium TaxID=2528274 RepID=A0A932GMX6_UNCTE|nr:DUF3108 domain-containing protein [Candidatus Tectomicrobia bacterium]
MRRRDFLGFFASAVAGVWLVFPPVRRLTSPGTGSGTSGPGIIPSPGPVAGRDPSVDRFLGENLAYDISFLWFKNAAQGTLRFLKDPATGSYKAVLEAATEGFVGFVSGYRRHRYTSTMSFAEGERKLRSEKFEIDIQVASSNYYSVHTMNYKTRDLLFQEYENSEKTQEEKTPIPAGVEFEDILSGFYNFRYGVYGPPIKGKAYTLRMLPRRGRSRFDVYLASTAEEREEKARAALTVNAAFLAYVVIPREIFQTKTGKIRLWLGEDLIPLVGTVEDAIGLGDVQGTLKSRNPPPARPS